MVNTHRQKTIGILLLFCLSFINEGLCTSKSRPFKQNTTCDTILATCAEKASANDTLQGCLLKPIAQDTLLPDTSVQSGFLSDSIARITDSATFIRFAAPTSQDSLSQMLLDEFFLSDELRFYDARHRYQPKDSTRIEAWNNLALDIPVYDSPDSIYRNRIDSLNQGFLVKLSYNQTVRNYIEVYVNKRRQQVDVMLALSQYYFPIFEQAMAQNGVPQELKYLAIIESGLNPRAVSRAGASGCWQFMYGTGKMYDLDIDLAVDERMDPFKASHAAARYLKDLHESFGDWTLAIAAYNCGPGNVRKAIRRARGKTDFWQIYPFLPRETRGYVPAFIGATYAMNYNEEHGIPLRSQPPILTDTLMVSQDLNLKVVAEHLDIPVQILRDLNPQYRMDVIPGNTDYYSIRLPINFKVKFMENAQDIYADDDNTMPPTPARFQHRVKRGETLSGIAAKYHVRVSHIMELNHLRSSTIYPNQLLYIYSNALPSSQKSQKQTKPKTVAPGTYEHKVRSGESVYAISRMYPGSTVNDIIRTNNLDAKGRIYPGQILQIQVNKQ